MVSAEIPQCSRHICELLFLILVLGLNLLLLLNDWPLWLKRMGQRRTALRVIVRQLECAPGAGQFEVSDLTG